MKNVEKKRRNHGDLQGGAVGLGLASLWAFGLKKQETVQHYI